MPRIVRVFIDMDGVVADWMLATANLFGLDKEDDRVKLLLYKGGWDGKLEDLVGGREALDNGIAARGEEFWLNIPEFEHTRENVYRMICSLSAWMQDGDLIKFAFLTSPSTWAELSCNPKQKWLRARYPDIPVIIAERKELLAQPNAWLIDDSANNCRAFNRYGGNVYQYPTQVNYLDEAEIRTEWSRVILAIKEWYGETKQSSM